LPQGRWPANLIHDGSDEVMELFPQSKSTDQPRNNSRSWGDGNIYGVGNPTVTNGYSDTGSAARFFYCAKASKRERDEVCEELEEKLGGSLEGGNDKRNGDKPQLSPRTNHHPTVKPIALMEYLVKLVSREGAVIVDPFAGSGSTAIACVNLGRKFIGSEIDEDYFKIMVKRTQRAQEELQAQLQIRMQL